MTAADVISRLKREKTGLAMHNGDVLEAAQHCKPSKTQFAQFRKRLGSQGRGVHYEVGNLGNELSILLDDERGVDDALRSSLEKAAGKHGLKVCLNQNGRLSIGRGVGRGANVLCDGKEFDQIVSELAGAFAELYDVLEPLLKKADSGELIVGGVPSDAVRKEEPVPEMLVDNVLTSGEDPFCGGHTAVVVTVEQLLQMKLRIPEYQRPYKWTRRNVEELLQDIKASLEGAGSGSPDANPLKYRLGTVILNVEGGVFEVVDGQQRILTLLLIDRLLNGIRKNKVECPLMKDASTLRVLSRSRISRMNLHENDAVVRSWLGKDYELRKKLVSAFASTLEVVVVKVDRLTEAFQLFDSQNTRGRALDPHDLLKAFHLRAMMQKAKAKHVDNAAEMLQVVTEWEAQSQRALRDLFDDWLFRIGNWGRKRRTHRLEAKDIHVFKGVPFDSRHSFAMRAKAAMPTADGDECRRFQIGEDFEEGREFFRMTAHYMRMVSAARGDQFYRTMDEVKSVLKCADGRGFSHAEKLFRCALVAYVDRFGEEALADDPRVIRKLCAWAFSLRLDMRHVSEDSINKYAVIEAGSDYTNQIPMFSVIKSARKPSDIAIVDVRGTSRRQQGVEGRAALVKALQSLEV